MLTQEQDANFDGFAFEPLPQQVRGVRRPAHPEGGWTGRRYRCVDDPQLSKLRTVEGVLGAHRASASWASCSA